MKSSRLDELPSLTENPPEHYRREEIYKLSPDHLVMQFYFFCIEPFDTLVHDCLHIEFKGERIIEKLSWKFVAGFEKDKDRQDVVLSQEDTVLHLARLLLGALPR
jgi:hypothetical protein